MIPINPAPIDVFLQPGDVYFGDRHTRLRTILGSCVSITLWHPQRLLGGMCHFILPARPAAGTLDGPHSLHGGGFGCGLVDYRSWPWDCSWDY